MATAAELLAGVIEVDKTLIVDNDFRTIKIPSSVPNLGVEYDDDVLRLDFKMPRYVSNTDLSGFSIRINYINSNGDSDAYTVSDAVIGTQYITFTWLVGPTATRYKGDTKFNICAKTLKADGETVDREFNTTIATLPVLEGLEVDEAIVSEYSDLLEQWRQKLFGIGDTEEASIRAVSQNEQAAIEAKGAEVLATIPAEYTETEEAAQEGIRTKADAIVCSAEGEVIIVSDSSDDYIRGLKVFGKTSQVTTTGKNLLNTDNTATFLNNMSSEKTGVVVPIEQDGTYAYYIGDSITAYIGYSDSFTTPATHYASALKDKPATGTITLQAGQYFMIWFDTGITVRDKSKYSLAFGTEVTHEPYSGGKPAPSPEYPQEMVSIQPTITIHGKNLFDIESLRVTEQADGGYLLPQYPKKTMIFFVNGYSGPITISGLIKYESTDSRGGFIEVIYTDGTSERVVGVINPSLDYQRYKHTTDTNKVVSEIAVTYGVGTVTTYFKDIQVEFGSVATAYEPYLDQLTPSSRTLPAIPVVTGGNYTDANGQEWISDEIDFERGLYIQRVRECELTGDDRWTVSNIQSGFKEGFVRYDGTVTTPGTARNESRWSHFPYKGTSFSDGYGAWVHVGNDTRIGVRLVTQHESVEALSEYLATLYAAGTPVKFQYILATPIETPLTAEEIQWFRFAHTNFPNTTLMNDAGAIMELKYNSDIKTWLENTSTTGATFQDYPVGNMMAIVTDVVEGYCYFNNSGILDKSINSDYKACIVKVKPRTDYTAQPLISHLVFLDADKKPITENAYDLMGVKTFNSGDAEYIAFNVDVDLYDYDTFVLSRGNYADDSELKYEIPWLYIGTEKESNDFPHTDTDYLADDVYSLKESCLSASMYFDDFTSAKIGYTKTNDVASEFIFYFEITATDIISHIRTWGNEVSVTKAHGLTIENFLNAFIHFKNNRYADITINTTGGSFTETFLYDILKSAYPFCQVTGTNVSKKLALSIPKIDKSAWFFGDSYFEYEGTRWRYYLGDYGENALFNGHSGANSYMALSDVKTLLKYGTPKQIVWCLGMNDGSDSTTPSPNWKEPLDELTGICEKNGIELVLATIPTVPTVNNEQKNAYIRTSGYRYIDFAKAVGATPEGVWYDGFLSSDNVHPSTTGGRALCARVFTDFPELTIG